MAIRTGHPKVQVNFAKNCSEGTDPAKKPRNYQQRSRLSARQIGIDCIEQTGPFVMRAQLLGLWRLKGRREVQRIAEGEN